MVISFIQALGPWTWVAVGLLILGIEIMMPSTLLLWPGLSALAVGFITLVLGTDAAIWPWQAQLIGQTAILADPIANGMGRVKIGDTTWRVKGDDTKAGAKVTVVDYDAGMNNTFGLIVCIGHNQSGNIKTVERCHGRSYKR